MQTTGTPNRVTPNRCVELRRRNHATILTTACSQMSREFPKQTCNQSKPQDKKGILRRTPIFALLSDDP